MEGGVTNGVPLGPEDGPPKHIYANASAQLDPGWQSRTANRSGEVEADLQATSDRGKAALPDPSRITRLCLARHEEGAQSASNPTDMRRQLPGCADLDVETDVPLSQYVRGRSRSALARSVVVAVHRDGANP
jgi:hypothetical protein